jgi:DNA alkylation repair enzyme
MTIPSTRLAQLNSGQDASKNLAEGLAVDFAALMAAALPQADAALLDEMRAAAPLGISKRMLLAGELVYRAVGAQGLARLAAHRSDTVRGWTCYALAHEHALHSPAEPLENLLEAVRPFADDAHFGVREWVWMAVRPHLAKQPEHALRHLAGWTADPSERVRRFASESTRPRGVWCAHLNILKVNPALGLPVLNPCRPTPPPMCRTAWATGSMTPQNRNRSG